MSRRAILVLCLGLLAAARKPPDAAYGTKVRFAKGRAVRFPHFELVYLGERREASAQYPRGFLFHDFEVSADGAKRTVSWTAGTGDIGPAGFAFRLWLFDLELRRSDRLGKLADDELVVWSRGPVK